MSSFSLIDWFQFSGYLGHMRDQAILLVIEPFIDNAKQLEHVLFWYHANGNNVDSFNVITEESFLANFPVYLIDKGFLEGDVKLIYWLFRVSNKELVSKVNPRRTTLDWVTGEEFGRCASCCLYKEKMYFPYADTKYDQHCWECIEDDDEEEDEKPLIVVSSEEVKFEPPPADSF